MRRWLILISMTTAVGCGVQGYAPVAASRASSPPPQSTTVSPSDAGSTLDAGEPAPAIDSGEGDAGTPLGETTPDAGSWLYTVCPDMPDGGTPVALPETPSTACLATSPEAASADTCDLFRRRFDVVPSMFAFRHTGMESCAIGSTDGEGHLAFGAITDDGAQPARYGVFNQDGQQVGSFAAMAPSLLMGESGGFQVQEYIEGSAGSYGGPLRVYDSDSDTSWSDSITSDDFPAVPVNYRRDPLDGTVTAMWKQEMPGPQEVLWTVMARCGPAFRRGSSLCRDASSATRRSSLRGV